MYTTTLVLTKRLPETGMRALAAYLHTAFERMALACAKKALAGLDGTLDPSIVVNAEALMRK